MLRIQNSSVGRIQGQTLVFETIGTDWEKWVKFISIQIFSLFLLFLFAPLLQLAFLCSVSSSFAFFLLRRLLLQLLEFSNLIHLLCVCLGDPYALIILPYFSPSFLPTAFVPLQSQTSWNTKKKNTSERLSSTLKKRVFPPLIYSFLSPSSPYFPLPCRVICVLQQTIFHFSSSITHVLDFF